MELKKETDRSNFCIFCQKKGSCQAKPVNDEVREKIRIAALARNDFEMINRMETIGREFKFHNNNKCYKNYTHKIHLERVKAQYENIDTEVEDGPCSSTLAVQRQTRKLYPNMTTVTKSTCIVCDQVKKGSSSKLFRICEEDRATIFLKATRHFQDEVFTRTSYLTNVASVFAADINYHDLCLRKYLRKFDRKQATKASDKDDEKASVAINYIEEIVPELKRGKAFTLTQISKALNERIATDYTFVNRQVKKFLMDKFGDDIGFSKPSNANLPTMFWLLSAVSSEEMVNVIRSKDEIRSCAKILKDSFLSVNFGLEDEFCDEQNIKLAWEKIKIPPVILNFYSELFDFSVDQYEEKKDLDFRDDEYDSQYLKVKSIFQMMAYVIHKGRQKTPLHVLNGLSIHHACRSSDLIKIFNHIGVSISYDEVLRIRNDLATYTVETSGENVTLPSHFHKSRFTVGSFDNFDHNEATLSGLESTHDTVSVLFQDEPDEINKKPKISETSVKHRTQSFKCLPCQQIKDFIRPPKKITLPPEFGIAETVSSYDPRPKEQKEFLWNLCRLSRFENDTVESNSGDQDQIVPTWAAFNSLITTEKKSRQIVGYLPVIPRPVTEYSTVYTALKNFQNILSQLDQDHLPVACDEGVYRIAQHIMLARPTEFENIVLLLGSFHMSKIAMACIGKYLKGSGADTIFIENSVFGVAVTETVMNGSNFSRSFKGLLLLCEALQRLQMIEFFKAYAPQSYREETSHVQKIQSHIANKEFSECKDEINNSLELFSEMFSDFQKYIEARCQESELFLYWDNVIRMITIAKDLVRSDRERNHNLQVATVEKLQPLFLLFDRTNYIRWSSIFLEDMKRLPLKAPEVYNEFNDGKCAVNRTNGNFKAVGFDMALEQTINKSKKSTSGIVGQTQKKNRVTEWELVYHEVLAISNLHHEKTAVSRNYELEQHHNMHQAYTTNMEEHIKNMMSYIIQHQNPFAEGSHPLMNIITQQEVHSIAKEQLLNVFTIGNKLVETYRKERYIEKTCNISDVIHKVKFPSFDTQPASSSSNKTKNVNIASAHRIIELARERNYSQEQLFQYDLVNNTFLFDNEGFFTKSIKSSLMTEFEKHKEAKAPYKVEKIGELGPVAVQIDVMSYLRKIPHVIDCATFGIFAATFCGLIKKSIPQKAKRIDFIFDSYFTNSPKAFERMRRNTGVSIEVFKINSDVSMPIQKDKFWSSASNKNKLQTFLKTFILAKNHFEMDVEVFCSAIFGDESSPCQSTKYSKDELELIEHPELSFENLEEADVRIMSHIHHAVKAGFVQILLISTDTDVSALSVYHWRTFHEHGLKELWMKIGSGNTIRHIAIHGLSRALGPDLCSVIIAIHLLTGCDVTSKFGTKHGGLTSNAFKSLFGFGSTRDCSDEMLRSAETFLVQLLRKKSQCQTMDELRYSLHLDDPKMSLDRLPPTSRSTRKHILRAFYNANIQMNCLYPQSYLDMTNFGYKYNEEDDTIVPDKGVQLYPPEDELVPNCTDGKCTRKSCRCAQAGISCCLYCKCHNDDCRNPHLLKC